MKICMVVPVPPPYGGIANWTKLMDEYVKCVDGVELSFVNTAPKKRSMEGRTLWDRVVVQGFDMFRLNKQMKKMLKAEVHDAVHMTTSGQLATFRDILMLKTARKLGIPSVYHIRFGRVPEIAKKNTNEWQRLKKAMLLADRVMAIDIKTFSAIKEYAPEVNVCYVPNPFDMSKVANVEINVEPKKEVVFVGWVIKSKGVEELLCAWQSICEKYPDWTLKIVGPCNSEYKSKLETTYSCKNVVFTGEQSHDEVLKTVSQAAVFTLPSYTEGFPNAVLEAMALKKPIVATSVGAIPDMLEGCGVVVSPENTKELEKALSDLLCDEGLRDELACKAKQKLLNEYTIETIFDVYKTVWREIGERKILMLSVRSRKTHGGIATWTENFLEGCRGFENRIDIVNMELVGKRRENTAAIRNLFDEYKRTKRVFSELKRRTETPSTRFAAAHLNTSCGTYGLFRDYAAANRIKKKGIRLITHYHCNVPDCINSIFSRFVIKKLCMISDENIVLCESSKEYLEKIGCTACTKIPNFVEEALVIDTDKNINSDIKKVVFVGRISRKKGAVKIYELAKRFPDMTFELIGDMSEEMSKMQKSKNISVLGAMPHEKLIERVDTADLFLFPSYSEGFSLALTEAMARGIPIVATDVGANRDMLSDNCGLIVNVGDVDAMEKAIISLKNVEIRQEMSRNAVCKVRKNYVSSVVVNKILEMYE